MNRGAWRATVHGVAKSRTQLKQLSMHACMVRNRYHKDRGLGLASHTGRCPTQHEP